MPELPSALSEASQNLWDDFRAATTRAGLTPPTDPIITDYLKTGFAASRFVAKVCINRPALAMDLLTSEDLGRAYQDNDLRDRFSRIVATHAAIAPNELSDQLLADIPLETFQNGIRLFRNREMLRIAIRDLTGLADINTILAELSDLADFCIQKSLRYSSMQMARQWGAATDDQAQAQHPVVLGMGKLGARELNFSSDIDLIFAYPKDGQTTGATKQITNEDYFTRLCRMLIQVLSAKTAEGFVFRVDTRLRPFGESGPLVLSFDRMEDYYQTQGREWERYALIKARAVAGDIAAGNQLLTKLSPFVFRRYLDYSAFESLRDMKQRIAMEVKSKGLQDNIKLGAGGIREIEFFGQIFQLIRGGFEPELRQRSIQAIIRFLKGREYIPEQTGHDLTQAYTFLRRVENRLQAYQDQQTHDLPRDPTDRERLAYTMGYPDWEQFVVCLEDHRRAVHHHFNALLAEDKESDDQDAQSSGRLRELAGIWQEVVGPDSALKVLADSGYTNPANALGLIGNLRNSKILQPMSATGRDRLAKIMPSLLQEAGGASDPQLVLARLFDLIKSICRRTAYLSLLCEYPTALTHLVKLSEASPWIAALLSRHPVLLDELLDPRTLYQPPHRNELRNELRARLDAVPQDDLEHQLETMRVYKQINVLRVAASDITNVLPLMKVSDHLSDIAEIVLDEVVDLSWRHLVAKHGRPACQLPDRECRQGFTVIAYGKLGGLELGYRSDLDLVFLHAAAPGQTQGGRLPIDNAQFFARLGQRVLHFLSTPTAAGILYDADMRLRPSGDSGMLVSHIEGFRNYQLNDAWTWEHQALIRARAIAGDEALQQRFAQIRTEALALQRNEQRLCKEVADMRQKLRDAQEKTPAGKFDIKQGSGGIVDIEFLVQYLILLHTHRLTDIAQWTDNVRLLQELATHNLLDTDIAFGLRRAYLILRAMAHRLNLRDHSALIDDSHIVELKSLVQRCWHRYLGSAA